MAWRGYLLVVICEALPLSVPSAPTEIIFSGFSLAQGNLLTEVVDMLTKEYGIPSEYIDLKNKVK